MSKTCRRDILVQNVWKTQSSTLILKMTSAVIILLSSDNASHCVLLNIGFYDNGGEETRVIEGIALQSRVYCLELQLRHFVANYRYSQALRHLFKDSWKPEI